MDAKKWLRRNQIIVYAVAVTLSIALGVGRPVWSTSIEGLINPVLAVLLYVTPIVAETRPPFARTPRNVKQNRVTV